MPLCRICSAIGHMEYMLPFQVARGPQTHVPIFCTISRPSRFRARADEEACLWCRRPPGVILSSDMYIAYDDKTNGPETEFEGLALSAAIR
jgi:hypothetical protein